MAAYARELVEAVMANVGHHEEGAIPSNEQTLQIKELI